MRKINTPTNHFQQEIQEFKFQHLASDPVGWADAVPWWRTTINRIKMMAGGVARIVPFLANSGTPTANGIGQAGALGSSGDAALADHAHATPGIASSGVDGFMSGTQADNLATAYAHAGSTGNPHGTTIANISGLQSALDGKSNVGHGHAISDVSGLSTALAAKADLVGGVIPSSQLPSYVDDVLEYVNRAAFPATGEAGKIYLSLDDNHQWRWGGSTYIDITSVGAQPLDAELTAIANLVSAADRLPYFTGLGSAALAVFTSFGRSLLSAIDASAALATLGAIGGRGNGVAGRIMRWSDANTATGDAGLTTTQTGGVTDAVYIGDGTPAVPSPGIILNGYSGSSYPTLNFRSTGDTRTSVRWENSEDQFAVLMRNDDGSLRNQALLIPRTTAASVQAGGAGAQPWTFKGTVTAQQQIVAGGPYAGAQIVVGGTTQAGQILLKRGSDGSPVGGLGYMASATEASEFRIAANGGGGYLALWTAGAERARLTASGNWQIAGVTRISSDGVATMASLQAENLSGSGVRPLVADASGNIDDQSPSNFCDTIGAVQARAFIIGDASATTFTLTHSLGTKDVRVTVRRNSAPWDMVEVSDELDAADPDNKVKLTFYGETPAVNSYRVVVMG